MAPTVRRGTHAAITPRSSERLALLVRGVTTRRWRSASSARWRSGTATGSSRCRAGSSVRCSPRWRFAPVRSSRPTGSSPTSGAKPRPRRRLGSLQNTVAALRKLIGRDVLVTQAPGYRLAVPREAVDVHRFERAVRRPRGTRSRAARARLLSEALELWRGPALADLDEQDFARVEAPRLDELRVAAQEDLIEAELELGRHTALVGELEALVRDPPDARSISRAADARALPLWPPGRGARGLPGGAARARRRARPRPLTRAAGAGAANAEPGSLA